MSLNIKNEKTHRQAKELARLAGETMTEAVDRAVAERLFVTEHTVEKHVKNILGTLCLPQSPDDHRRVLAVITYLNSQ